MLSTEHDQDACVQKSDAKRIHFQAARAPAIRLSQWPPGESAKKSPKLLRLESA